RIPVLGEPLSRGPWVPRPPGGIHAVSAGDGSTDERGADPARLPRVDDGRRRGPRRRAGSGTNAPGRQLDLRLRRRRGPAGRGPFPPEPGRPEEPCDGLRGPGRRGDRPREKLFRGIPALFPPDRDPRQGPASLHAPAPRDRGPHPGADRRRARRRLPEARHAGGVKKKITVLGCGLVGAAIARDLSREAEFELTVADASPAALGRLGDHPSVASIRRVEADLSDRRRLASLVEGADAVVGALPGRLGFAMLERVVHIGRPIADISFSPENPLALDDLAQDSGSTAVVDCGVSPGISNFAVGRAAAGLSRVEEVTIRVGGLPADRERPFEYAIVFSASD